MVKIGDFKAHSLSWTLYRVSAGAESTLYRVHCLEKNRSLFLRLRDSRDARYVISRSPSMLDHIEKLIRSNQEVSK